jgi:RecA-family ATPase
MKLNSNQTLVDSYLGLLSAPTQTSVKRVATNGIADQNAVNQLAEAVKGYVPKLWDGDWESQGKYPSQSEADFAVCGLLTREALVMRIPDNALQDAVCRAFALSDLFRPEKENQIAKYAVPKLIASSLQTRDEFARDLREKGFIQPGNASNAAQHEQAFSAIHEQKPTIIETPQSARYQLIPASCLLTTKPPPRNWIIKDFLPSKIVATLIASGGTGKSFLAMHIAVTAAAGSSLFSKFLATKSAKVVFISGEDDKIELQRRIHAVTQGMSEALRAVVGSNIHFVDVADSFELFTNKTQFGEVHMTAVPELLVECIKETVGDEVDLVIVDPVSRFRGGEENSAGDTTRFVQALQYVRDKLNTTVLTLHHVNKGAKANGSSQNNARGSSAFIDGVRLVYELNALSEDDVKKQYGSSDSTPRLLTLNTVKTNYGSPIETLTLSKRLDGSLELFTMQAGDHQKMAILQEIKITAFTKSQFKETYGHVKGKFGLSQKALVQKLDAFAKEGLINTPTRSSMQLTQFGQSLLNT